jgi:hypothetical protein
MKIIACLAASIVALACGPESAHAADTASSPRPGEVRTIALAAGNVDAIAQLHREGWIEARGQLLSTADFPELFQAVGRTWTATDVAAGRFAIPAIHERTGRQISSDNPFGVLGPGDLVTSGLPQHSWLRSGELSEWIFAGRDVSSFVRGAAGDQR